MSVSYVLGSFKLIGLSVELNELNILGDDSFRIVGEVNFSGRGRKNMTYGFSGEMCHGNLFLSFDSEIPPRYEKEAYDMLTERLWDVIQKII